MKDGLFRVEMFCLVVEFYNIELKREKEKENNTCKKKIGERREKRKEKKRKKVMPYWRDDMGG